MICVPGGFPPGFFIFEGVLRQASDQNVTSESPAVQAREVVAPCNSPCLNFRPQCLLMPLCQELEHTTQGRKPCRIQPVVSDVKLFMRKIETRQKELASDLENKIQFPPEENGGGPEGTGVSAAPAGGR